MTPVRFSTTDPGTIARWVLECPFLSWDVTAGGVPKLSFKLPDASVKLLEVQAVLGRGGFGVVFEATDGAETFAIKVPTTPTGGSAGLTLVADNIARLIAAGQVQDACVSFDAELKKATEELYRILSTKWAKQQLKKFQRESTVLQRLSHPNLVDLRFVGEITPGLAPTGSTSLPCMAMEMVTGTSLRDVIMTSTMHLKEELPTILRVCRDVALAVAAIHDLQLYHRDLSWNNIMIGDDGSVTVIDLGNVNDPERCMESIGELLETPDFPIPLTPGFVSPEHWNLWRPTSASDQFALGVAIYLWCCKGVSWPYQPRPLGAFETNNSADPEQPIPLKKRKQAELRSTGWNDSEKKVFERLSAIVDRMLQKQELKRFPCMRDVAAELHSLLIDLGEESYKHFDAVESQPVDGFVELCHQVNFKKPAVPHGCLFLQMSVNQARLQLTSSIDHVWETLFDTFHVSADLGTLEGMAKSVEQIDRMLNDLITAMRVVLLAFSRTPAAASGRPRFGGRLQQQLSKVKEHLQPLFLQSRKCKKLVDACVRQPDEGQEQFLARKDKAIEQATGQVTQLWNVVSDTQRQLAICDFDLAVYTMRLRRVLAESQKST